MKHAWNSIKVKIIIMTVTLFAVTMGSVAVFSLEVEASERKLDYYEYYFRGSKEKILFQAGYYTYGKLGRQVEYKEYNVTSQETAALSVYILEGYDDQGNCVYRRIEESATGDCTETYFLNNYDEEGRIAETVSYIDGQIERILSYHYYDNGMSACAVQIYNKGVLNQESSYDVLYDADGQAVFYKAYGKQEYSVEDPVQETEEWSIEELGQYDREELAHQGDRLVYYRWYNHDEQGRLRELVEVLPKEESGKEYRGNYIYYSYDSKGHLNAIYAYEIIPRDYYYVNYRRRSWNEEIHDTAIYLLYDTPGRITQIDTTCFTDTENPGINIYSIMLHEDGSYDMSFGSEEAK
ncbi:MAG: hypothetical protein J1E64_04145 [Acetatifactor sp.]|nr:hypothetical protein [Acetatifactor sp.]